ncbi:MAG: UDP-glucose 4-epimerase GalE [Lentisphaerae bacterium]|nr:UDP-glucose 4-epimerase GalE [Lentisphaerota bacterium]
MKIFVTGGAGYIGSVTVERMLDRGHDVLVFDNLERGHRKAVDPRARLVVGDLRERDAILPALSGFKPDAVMHFAAYARVEESVEQPFSYFRNNVNGVINLAEAMVTAGVRRFVFSSTCAVYGEPVTVPISEDHRLLPENPYGWSKRMAEQVLEALQQAGTIHPVCLRYFNACGATERFGEAHEPETHLIPIALEVAAGRREKILMYGDDYETTDGTCVRDYIHVVDLAEAHILALTTDHAGAFNLGTGRGHSVREVIETAESVTGCAVTTEVTPRRPGDPSALIAEPAKAERLLGWRAERADLGSVIESAWKWMQSHPSGYSS